MKKRINILLFSALTIWLITAYTSVNAQESAASKGKLDASADIVSRYIWRGMNLGGSAPSIQPSLEFSSGNLAIGTWGAYSFAHAVTRQEVDLYASYTISDVFTVTATDYFLPEEDSAENHYFNYQEKETGHLFEVSAKFLGNKDIPISILVATNVYGSDARKANGDIQYSTYLELGYEFEFRETTCNAFLGFTPTKPNRDKGETGFYGPYPGVVNIGFTGSKEIPITEKFSLPVNVSLITNPQAENIFLVFGISL